MLYYVLFAVLCTIYDALLVSLVYEQGTYWQSLKKTIRCDLWKIFVMTLILPVLYSVILTIGVYYVIDKEPQERK